jgi:hypothetical protein
MTVTYILLAVVALLGSALWIGYVDPFLQEGIDRVRRNDAARQEEWERRRQEQIREEEDRLRREEGKGKIGKFLKFAFPIIRRASPALVAPNLVSVQPMTGPVGGIAFYRSQYGEELRTVLDDIVDALDEDDEKDLTDADRRCGRIAERIVWEVFHDHPYSSYYGKTSPTYVEQTDIKGPPVVLPPEETDLVHRAGSFLLEHEARARTLLAQDSAGRDLLRKWSPTPLDELRSTLLGNFLQAQFRQSGNDV